MKDTEWKLISELIKNSRKSDRELAKAIGASQPTVSRLRSKLEKKLVREYTMLPEVAKLGFEILAISFAKMNLEKQVDPRLLERARDFVKKHPNIIFSASGQGVESDHVAISIHRDYAGYAQYIQELDREYGEFFTRTGSFIISLSGENVSRPLSLRPIIGLLKKGMKSK